jgi:hypothetical protein
LSPGPGRSSSGYAVLEQNRGVAYEIGKLVDEVPLNRVVLLFDESTDLNVLKDILARAHEGIPR